MASTVDIWNLALNLVGGKFVVDPLEKSTEADLCRLHYQYALDFVLESADWNFAVKRAEITVSADVEPVFTFASSFKIPSDCARLIEVWDNKRANQNNRYVNNDLQWQQEGGYISANTGEQVYIRYIEKVEDPNRFSSSFTAALSTYLAYRLSIPVSGNRSLKSDLLGEYNLMLKEAAANNGLTGRTKIVRSNVLVGARFRNA